MNILMVIKMALYSPIFGIKAIHQIMDSNQWKRLLKLLDIHQNNPDNVNLLMKNIDTLIIMHVFLQNESVRQSFKEALMLCFIFQWIQLFPITICSTEILFWFLSSNETLIWNFLCHCRGVFCSEGLSCSVLSKNFLLPLIFHRIQPFNYSL